MIASIIIKGDRNKLELTMQLSKKKKHYKKKDDLASFLLASVMIDVAKFNTLRRLKHKRHYFTALYKRAVKSSRLVFKRR